MKPQVILLDMNNEHHDEWDRPTAGWGQTGQWDSQWETSAAAPAQERRGKGRKAGIIVGAIALVAGAGVAGAMILQGVLDGGSGTDSAEPVVVYSTEVVTAEEDSPADATGTTGAAARVAEPAADVCDPDVVLADLGVAQWDVVDGCDGEWAMAGAKNSDDLGVVRYTNGRWAGYDHCADGRDVVPEALQRFLHTCDTRGTGPVGPSRSSGGHSVPSARGPIQASSPACDGRGILIVNSVVEQPGVSTEQQLTDALNAVPGTEYTLPGQCSSLRASLEGAAVYPVYIDYGSDRQALCAGKARYGGNARTLNTVGDFHDPC